MDSFSVFITGLAPDSTSLLLEVIVFVVIGALSFFLLGFAQTRTAVKVRTARIVVDDYERAENAKRSLRYSSLKTVARLIEYTNKHYATASAENMKVIRKRLIQAGIFDPRAVAYFFIGRAVLAIAIAAALFVLLPLVSSRGGSFFWLVIMVGGIAGYIGPSLYIDRRITTRRREHSYGFPDFMDLLVVCANSGLSMEASLARVAREMGDSYPSLTANIHITNLEIRAGRGLKDALERFASRLALDDARAFVVLINQSIDLGSSITDALRVYSDDMRHKRLSLAEEKAYALPVKLSLPMMICIFPVLFVVILLPVFVRLYTGHY